MVISNQLNGPFSRIRALTLFITLIVVVNVFVGLTSLGCAMATKMTDPHTCLTQVHIGNRLADSCALPSIGETAMTAMTARSLVSMALNPARFVSNANLSDQDSFDQSYPDPLERPPRLT